jgi:hypothetical protein
MSTLVVTGTRTERFLKDVPVTTQVIKAEKLRESGGADVSQVLGQVTGIAVVENQFGLYEMKTLEMSLEEIFLQIIGEEAASEAAAARAPEGEEGSAETAEAETTEEA